MISEQEKLEFESLPEFVREPYASMRQKYSGQVAAKAEKDLFAALDKRIGQMESKYQATQDHLPEPDNHIDELVRPRHEALDTLWPGVERDFFQENKRSPSFYLTLGFMAGACISLAVVFIYSFLSHGLAPGAGAGSKKIVVAGLHQAARKPGGNESGKSNAVNSTVINGEEVLTPEFATYEVKSGDTLAGIALKAYRRVSPRMLDAICKANNMRSADVLSLGQKLTLPEYHSASGKVAAGTALPPM